MTEQSQPNLEDMTEREAVRWIREAPDDGEPFHVRLARLIAAKEKKAARAALLGAADQLKESASGLGPVMVASAVGAAKWLRAYADQHFPEQEADHE